MTSLPNDLIRTLLAILFVCALAVFSLWILKPFLPALLWATMIAVATWPLLLAAQAKLRNRRWAAVTVMIAALLLVFVIPFTMAIGTIADNAGQIITWGKALAAVHLPATAPEWLANLPGIGKFAAGHWQQLFDNQAHLAQKITPYIRKSVAWFITEVGNFGMLTMQFLLTAIIAAILYGHGEAAAASVRRFGFRLAGSEGENAVLLAAQAIRGVALGVVVTALVQSALAGLGLLVAGIPFAAILTAVIFMLAIAQLGPFLVLAPSVGWLFWMGDNTWGTALLVWTVFVGSIDNILRPLLIKKGADLPLLLIFSGVIGGLIAFGLVGIFIGPVVLAVTYTLLTSWMAEAPPIKSGPG